MEDKEFRKKLNEYGEENELEIILLDNPSFDRSIIGVTMNGAVIYDFDLMVEELMEDDEIEELEAIEFIEYNTIRAVAYMGENAPIIMTSKKEIDNKY